MNLCKYANIFGAPGTGAHSYRFMDFAIVDVSLTILLGLLIANYFKTDRFYTVIGTFIVGIISHRLFCVRTTIDKILFP
jgi:hypothetical protein